MTTPIPKGSERYACGCTSVVMRAGITVWTSDEVSKLKASLLAAEEQLRTLREGALLTATIERDEARMAAHAASLLQQASRWLAFSSARRS